MRFEHTLISLLGLICCFFLVAFGIFLFSIALSPHLNLGLRTLLSQNPRALLPAASGFMVVGLCCFLLFAWLNRRRYLHLKMRGISIAEGAVTHLTLNCLQSFFPGQKIECTVRIKWNQQLEILACLPKLEEAQEEETLVAIEEALAQVLQKHCLYIKDFFLTVSFSAQSGSEHPFQ
jgi:hypothetical protein